MYGPQWPTHGEIDIIEGINEKALNQMHLHTTAGCMLDGSTSLSRSVHENCHGSNEGMSDCGVQEYDATTYGDAFNQHEGGLIALEWTSDHIAVWRFNRGSQPADLLSSSPNPSQWGTPVADFRGNCDISSHFSQQTIVSFLVLVLFLFLGGNLPNPVRDPACLPLLLSSPVAAATLLSS